MTRARPLLLAIAALVAVVGCTSRGAGVDTSKPVDAVFSTLDGSPSSFAAYRGSPTVVNFFSSTCVPCVTEMPALEQLHQQLGAKVRFLGLDVQETATAAQSFLATVKVTWDIGRDPDGSILTGTFRGAGMPSTVLLAPDGTVAKTWLNGKVPINELTDLIHQKGYA